SYGYMVLTRTNDDPGDIAGNEAVGVGLHSVLFAHFFSEGKVKPEHLVINMAGAVVKDNEDDLAVLRNYWDVAVKPRAKKGVGLWKAYYQARSYLR
ncbi:MAG: hypothetical protein AAFX99_18770, partial [Myxococcota bacterium]